MKEFGPQINSKLASTINKKLNLELEVGESYKKKISEIKIPQNVDQAKLKEFSSKHFGLDRYIKRNDHRLTNIQLLATKANTLNIQSTNILYSN